MDNRERAREIVEASLRSQSYGTNGQLHDGQAVTIYGLMRDIAAALDAKDAEIAAAEARGGKMFTEANTVDPRDCGHDPTHTMCSDCASDTIAFKAKQVSELFTKIEQARAEGERAGLEKAAKYLESEILNPILEVRRVNGPAYTAGQEATAAASEYKARRIIAGIRALQRGAGESKP